MPFFVKRTVLRLDPIAPVPLRDPIAPALREEMERWAKVVKAANVRID